MSLPHHASQRKPLTDEERAAVERALAQGKVTRCEPGEFPDAGRIEILASNFKHAILARQRGQRKGGANKKGSKRGDAV